MSGFSSSKVVPVVRVDTIAARCEGTPYSIEKVNRSRVWIGYEDRDAQGNVRKAYGIFPCYPHAQGGDPWVVLDTMRIVLGRQKQPDDDVTEDTFWRSVFRDLTIRFSEEK